LVSIRGANCDHSWIIARRANRAVGLQSICIPAKVSSGRNDRDSARNSLSHRSAQRVGRIGLSRCRSKAEIHYLDTIRLPVSDYQIKAREYVADLPEPQVVQNSDIDQVRVRGDPAKSSCTIYIVRSPRRGARYVRAVPVPVIIQNALLLSRWNVTILIL